jgi:hypothetical protein
VSLSFLLINSKTKPTIHKIPNAIVTVLENNRGKASIEEEEEASVAPAIVEYSLGTKKMLVTLLLKENTAKVICAIR